MTRRALLIGIRTYRSEIPDLVTPENDINALSAVLQSAEIGGFTIEEPAFDVSHYEFKERVQSFFTNAKPSDELLVYIACHGLLEGGRNLYFASKNTDPGRIAATSVSAAFLCDEMVKSPSEKVMALVDCCYGGRIEDFVGAQDQLTQRLDRSMAGHEQALLVLTSAGQYEMAIEAEELSRFCQVIVEGLRTGDADMDNDGYVRGEDLQTYVERRFGDLEYDQQPNLVYNSQAREIYISRNPKKPLDFDEQRYHREVLESFSRGRLTRDLVKRYQLRNPTDPAKSVEDMNRTLQFWGRRQSSVAYGACIRQLQEEHRSHYQAVFDKAARGEDRAIPEAMSEAARSSDALAEELEDLAGDLRIVPPSTVRDLTENGHSLTVIQQTMRSSDIAVATENLLPPMPPIPAYPAFTERMKRLRCGHLGVLLSKEDRRWLTGVSLLGPEQLTEPILVEATRDAYDRVQRKASGDAGAYEVLDLLVCLDEQELRLLLAYQIADQLRIMRRQHSSLIEMLEEADDFGLSPPDARQIVFVVQGEERRPSQDAERLIRLVEDGRVSATCHLLDRGLGTTVQADAIELSRKVRSWYQRAEGRYQDARIALDRDDSDRAWVLLNQGLQLAPDRGEIKDLLNHCPPRPVWAVRAQPSDDTVSITWERSESPAAGVIYLVKRAEGPEPGPDAGRTISQSNGVVFEDRNPPVNLSLWYAVVPARGGVSPSIVTWDGPVYVRPEVRDLQVTGRDSQVLLSWRTPADAVQIRIERRRHYAGSDSGLSEHESFAADRDSPGITSAGNAVTAAGLDHGTLTVTVIKASPSELQKYVDDSVDNDETYHFRLAAIYRDAENIEILTAGIEKIARPGRPPDPVVISEIEMVTAHPPQAVIKVGKPKAGTTVLYALEGRAPPFGRAMLRSELDSIGRPIPTAARASTREHDLLTVVLSEREIWLTAITLSGDWAAVGGSEQCRGVPSVPEESISFERTGDHISVALPWPNELHEMDVICEQDGLPVSESVFTQADYRARGLKIPLRGEHARVCLYPVILLPTRRMRGPRVCFDVPARYVVRYRLSYKRARRPFGSKRVLRAIILVAGQEVTVHDLCLRYASGLVQPLRDTDGKLVMSFRDLQLLADEPCEISIGLPFTAPFWLTCFTADADIDLRHPPPEERRRP